MISVFTVGFSIIAALLSMVVLIGFNTHDTFTAWETFKCCIVALGLAVLWMASIERDELIKWFCTRYLNSDGSWKGK